MAPTTDVDGDGPADASPVFDGGPAIPLGSAAEPASTGPPATEEPASTAVPLLVPSDPVVAPVTGLGDLLSWARRLADGPAEPVAIDAERASGFRYGGRAYLVQLRRRDTGTALLDPIALGDLQVLDQPLARSEWVLHAATQDLPCLAEAGIRPRRLFDTELAGRLAGFPRVGLAPLVERMLGLQLRKGHGAADWSTRPLPHDWLVYAALDVEVLVDLRDAMEAELTRQGKLEWAQQEFAALAAAPAPPRGPTRGAARRACTRSPIGARWPSSASCGSPGIRSPDAGTSPRTGCCPTPRSSPPRRPGRPPSPRWSRCPCSPAGCSAATPTPG